MLSRLILLFRNRLFKLGVLIVSLALVVSTTRTIYQLWQRRDVIGERQEAIKLLEAENKDLEQKLVEVESPEYIERVAREKLGLVKEGETVVLLPKSEVKSQESEEKLLESLPNWQKWWRLFF